MTKVATPEPKESESEPKEAAQLPINLDTNKPESNDGSISSGLDIAPMDAIIEMVNSNLRNCPCHRKTPLVFEPHRRVGFASNWKLTCSECEIEAKSVDNSITYLKSNLDSCKSNTERRSIKRKIYKKNERRAKFDKIRKKDKQYHPISNSPMK